MEMLTHLNTPQEGESHALPSARNSHGKACGAGKTGSRNTPAEDPNLKKACFSCLFCTPCTGEVASASVNRLR
jgi:hypothetical protein